MGRTKKHEKYYTIPAYQILAQKKDYDAIEFTGGMAWSDAFHGWDCDSILVMNPNVVIEKEGEAV